MLIQKKVLTLVNTDFGPGLMSFLTYVFRKQLSVAFQKCAFKFDDNRLRTCCMSYVRHKFVISKHSSLTFICLTVFICFKYQYFLFFNYIKYLLCVFFIFFIDIFLIMVEICIWKTTDYFNFYCRVLRFW